MIIYNIRNIEFIIKKKSNYNKVYFSKQFNYIWNKQKILILILLFINYIYIIFIKEKLQLNNDFLKIQKDLKFKFQKKLINKIKIAIYCRNIKNGGVERLTSILLNNLNKMKVFNIYLFTILNKEDDEYIIPETIQRIIIKVVKIKYLIININKKKLDIFIYQFYNAKEILILNKLKKTKTIFYNHSSFLIWIYSKNYYMFNTTYKEYANSKNVISIIPFENDFLFKKWGINSILMDNFMTFELELIKPSNLTSKIILMIGRASDKYKRFFLGIQAMEYIIQIIQECNMKIISNMNDTFGLQNLILNLNISNYIELVGYINKIDIYLSNASLHIFPTISEAFPMVLCETKIFGIPNILIGIDYVAMSSGGTIIIYDDSPEYISKVAINILKNDKYRKILGKQARLSMKNFNNLKLTKRWVLLILFIYNDYNYNYYQKLMNQDKEISYKNSLDILKNQVILLKKRKSKFENITVNNLLNFTFLQNLI